MSNLIDALNKEQMKKEIPEFSPGDTIIVQVKVKEQAGIEGREQIPELQGDTEEVLVQW